MGKMEELAKQAEARAAAYQQEALCKRALGADDGGILNAQSPEDFPGRGHGATPEQWPDGACGCGNWGSR